MNPSEMTKAIRRIVIERSYAAGVGHIGSCLSVAGILGALYAPDGGVLRLPHVPLNDHPWKNRDRFVLSCGHKALALYAALNLRGWISDEELSTFCRDGSDLYTHPNHHVDGVEFSTGSLGMGLSFAVGAALAARMEGSNRRVYSLLSDAELNEGSTWEAIMFAAHHKLNNLVAVIDCNGQQALGQTDDILDTSNIRNQLTAFGWRTGWMPACSHPGRLIEEVDRLGACDGPQCIVAATTFGDGVSFMECDLAWHYRPMSADEYALAMAEVSA